MDVKTKLFLVVSSIVSYICFNFNKVLRYVLVFMCKNLYDDSVPTYGPYTRTVPIDIEYANLDGKCYTNKFKLMMNWYWDGDVNGVMVNNLPFTGHSLYVRYTLKTDPRIGVNHVNIDFINNTINGKELLFGEMCLIP